MSINSLDFPTIASIIQIAVAPVFLLAGISGLLTVMTNRLGRVIDRTRILQQKAKQANDEQTLDDLSFEMERLAKRGQSINVAITLATTSALSICLVITCLFLGGLVDTNFANVIAILFIICMGLLIASLGLFLREVFLGTRSMKKGILKPQALLNNSDKS